jgi:hypothetical protein
VGPRAEIGPRAALLLLSALDKAERWYRSNGFATPAGWAEVYGALGQVAITGGTRPMPVRHAPPVDTAVAFADPIGATQAAYLLQITPRGVRDLCRREVLTTARRRPGGWVIERAEVEARAATRGVHPRRVSPAGMSRLRADRAGGYSLTSG